jgi:hypothetical protein
MRNKMGELYHRRKVWGIAFSTSLGKGLSVGESEREADVALDTYIDNMVDIDREFENERPADPPVEVAEVKESEPK